MKNLGVIQETSYLTTGNTPQYRRIMRIFFQEHEKMRFQLYKEEILELLRQYQGFEDYSMEQLKADLAMLVEWKNLTPIQDPKRVYTIADYKNKQFRYSMSDYAVEIERLTVKLEHLFMERGNLSSSYFVRIEEALSSWKQIKDAPIKEINEWWHNLQEDFRSLNQNYQDYLREFYSSKGEKILKSVEFMLHKDKFITYLREFIKELQGNAIRIEELLRGITQEEQQELLEKIVTGELEVPHSLWEIQQPMEQEVRETITGRWEALRRSEERRVGKEC